ncbi:hypothetical protein PGO_070480 [Plasmodium gonderi]|uniref:Uncharacterized protein n=1 Tax=Plasmodium gonderi TaxID=77519 RepID=A0A1Y1JI71_PLAGO|nr:hypothetical protein PGO_070480 [Plasmodium gonderi]GAW80133.1 hypothetical protein PGO_070480 [Plasmodium gonderi]
MNNDEVKFIENEYKEFYDKFSYINENTFCIDININDENEKSKNDVQMKTLKLVIKFHDNHFEVLNPILEQGSSLCQAFDNIEQIFDTFCPLSFKKFLSQRIIRKLNSFL